MISHREICRPPFSETAETTSVHHLAVQCTKCRRKDRVCFQWIVLANIPAAVQQGDFAILILSNAFRFNGRMLKTNKKPMGETS